MRIHSNEITSTQTIVDLLKAEQAAGRIAESVAFKTLAAHRSHSHRYAYEIQLESWAKVDGDGRRTGNSGSYGAGENYAATWDEWGWLLAALFEVDPGMRSQYYRDRETFDNETGLTYNYRELLDWLRSNEDPYPWLYGKVKAGNYGKNRRHLDAPTAQVRLCEWAPRTLAEYAAFARVSPQFGMVGADGKAAS